MVIVHVGLSDRLPRHSIRIASNWRLYCGSSGIRFPVYLHWFSKV
ncbi:Hypothetical protein c4543 [Escherichia coli CFT073]|uniref:Uncharacterized protein n=1 Tax=Escherichia coli O6:H1 (strain CFT073 / ATCC 700928 / UPEC) TaxID=199310 RepID=A0A0H2VCK7_ECOL6|nr:Hypothetical protein c4543 [Escherichia coli CFT073]